MLPLIAIPVIHSSGAWIASTAAGGYLASTLSATWAGAFVAGNASLLAGAGLAGLGAIGGFLAGTSSSLAATVGLAPATFLGLTPIGWAIAGGTTVALSATGGVLYWKSSRVRSAIDGVLPEINEARIEAGLKPFKSSWDLLQEVARFRKEGASEDRPNNS